MTKEYTSDSHTSKKIYLDIELIKKLIDDMSSGGWSSAEEIIDALEALIKKAEERNE
jgi:hypothetical protein